MSINMYVLAANPANEAARQIAVEESGILLKNLSPKLNKLAAVIRRQVQTDTAIITAVSNYNVYVIGRDNAEPGVLSRSHSFVGHLIEHDLEYLVILDAYDDARFSGNLLVLNGELRFYAAAAIRDNNGYTLGAVCLSSIYARSNWTAADQQHLRSAAEVAMHLIMKARL